MIVYCEESKCSFLVAEVAEDFTAQSPQIKVDLIVTWTKEQNENHSCEISKSRLFMDENEKSNILRSYKQSKIPVKILLASIEQQS